MFPQTFVGNPAKAWFGDQEDAFGASSSYIHFLHTGMRKPPMALPIRTVMMKTRDSTENAPAEHK